MLAAVLRCNQRYSVVSECKGGAENGGMGWAWGVGLVGLKFSTGGYSVRLLFPGMGRTEQWALLTPDLLTLPLTGMDLV